MNAVDEIYVPMGDTALIRAVAAPAKAANPEIRVVGVQAERAPDTTCPGSPVESSALNRPIPLRTGWQRVSLSLLVWP